MSNSDRLLDKFRIELPTDVSVSVCLEPEKTGLPFPIMIGKRPHLKVHDVEAGRKIASISIDDEVEVMNGTVPDTLWQVLLPYILNNHDLLLQYWDGEITARKYAKRQKLFAGMYKLVQEGQEGHWRMDRGGA